MHLNFFSLFLTGTYRYVFVIFISQLEDDLPELDKYEVSDRSLVLYLSEVRFSSKSNNCWFQLCVACMFFLPEVFFNTRKLTVHLTWNKGYSCISFSPSWADNAINWIIIYPMNSVIDFPNTYLLNSDLSSG